MTTTSVIFLLRRRIGCVYSHTRTYARLSTARAMAMGYCTRAPKERIAIVCEPQGPVYTNIHPHTI